MTQLFAVGDRVEFVMDYAEYACEGDRGVVKAVEPENEGEGPDEALVHVDLRNGCPAIAAFAYRLKHVLEPADVDAQPVTYRIAVGQTIGTTEYPSLEAAKEAALEHGSDKEEFSVFEVVKVADYRVKVTKDLETI